MSRVLINILGGLLVIVMCALAVVTSAAAYLLFLQAWSSVI